MEDEVASGRFVRHSMVDDLTYKDTFEKRLTEQNLDRATLGLFLWLSFGRPGRDPYPKHS